MKIAYTYVNSENNEEELNVSEIEDMWFEREYGMCISSFREDIYDQHCTDITREEFEKIKEKALANENLDLSGYKFYSMDDDDDNDDNEDAEEDNCCDEKPEYTEADSQACIVLLTIMVVVIVILIIAFYSGA